MIHPLNDEIGSVELIDHMGSDLMVVDGARVSMHKKSDWEYSGEQYDFSDIPTDLQHLTPDTREKKLKKEDKGLIKYLSSHDRWTPFGHPQLQFRTKMPIFVIREWYRHEVGFVRNEVSRRYVTEEPEFFIPSVWRKKPEKSIKQGSGAEFGGFDNWRFETILKNHSKISLEQYNWYLGQDVAPEQARICLPFNMYTEFIETASLYAYARLCRLRIAPDAQKETRLYAEAVAKQIEPLFPVAWTTLMAPKILCKVCRKEIEDGN